MNKNIVITTSAIITIAIIAYGLTQITTIEEENTTYIEESDKISTMLEKIKQDKIKNDNLDEPYIPAEREWITSGPFMIDRSEYVIGEKIFVNIGEFEKNTKGEMIFLKIINKTSGINYYEVPFENSKKPTDFYLSITPSKIKQMCTTDDLIGDWKLIFQGTNYESLNFKIKNKMIVGLGPNFESVC